MKIRTGKRWTSVAALVAMALFSTGYSSTVYALPQDSTITSGKAEISTTADTMTVNQSTDKVAINWQSFNIDKGETVNFTQPSSSSVALNRVIGNDASKIYGNLNANGRVFLINQNGILFGEGSQVNVGGLIASTETISDSDFNAGNYNFSGTSTAAVKNAGTIKAEGGVVALLASNVENDGSILTTSGTTALAAGSGFTVDYEQDGKINLEVNTSAAGANVLNAGTIKADGGYVLMTARDASKTLNTVVKNTGIIEAKSLKSVNGTIILDGGEQGTVEVGGSLDASGTGDGETGGTIKVTGQYTNVTGSLNAQGNTAGGYIETSGDVLSFGDDFTVDASALNGTNGTWSLDPLLVVIGDSSNTDGTSVVTGNHSVAATYTDDGKGTYDFSLTDTHKYNDYYGYSSNYTTSYISAATISKVLATGTDVTITATASETQGVAKVNGKDSGTTEDASGVAEIWVESAITGGNNATLTLNAERSIKVDAPITGTDGALNVVLHADTDGDGYGAVLLNDTIDTNGGSFTSATGSTLTSGTTGTYITVANPLITSGGAINIYGDLWLATGGVVTFDNGTGAVNISGDVVSSHLYKYVNNVNKITWANAEKKAEADGGYLVTISSAMENSIASSLVQGGTEVYAGASLGSDGKLYWVNDEGLVNADGSYTFWNTNEANHGDGSSQGYLALGYAAASKWDDVKTGALSGYVEEIDVGTSTLKYTQPSSDDTDTIKDTTPVEDNSSNDLSNNTDTSNDTAAAESTLTTYAVDLVKLDYRDTANVTGNGLYAFNGLPSHSEDVSKILGLTDAQLPFFKVAGGQVSNYGTYEITETPTEVKVTPTAKHIPEPNKEKSQYRSLTKTLDLTEGTGKFDLVYDGTTFNIYPADAAAKHILQAGDPQHNVEVEAKALFSSFNEMGLVLEDFDAIYVHLDATEKEAKNLTKV